MKIRTYFIGGTLILMLLAACGSSVQTEDLIAIPGSKSPVVSTAADQRHPAAAESTSAPAVAAPEISPVDPSGEALTVDAALVEIDGDVCARATATQNDLAALRAQGADVAELEIAVAELLAELETCP